MKLIKVNRYNFMYKQYIPVKGAKKEPSNLFKGIMIVLVTAPMIAILALMFLGLTK